ncbi:MAG TPA: adenylate/guanylate cyclase domain-containing protein, partial [Chloroflexota bacterium]|nr:adenylate/guanylate cyclase domain-containing protein [Chloroflexota bacterium]
MNASARGGSCPACGAAAPADQRFCGQCGAALGRACPACGADNPVAHRFCGSCGAQLEPGTSAAAPPGEERRWASVLFADLSGFTSISERMDPEDVKALAHHCSERLAEEVRRFGGTVINVMGDAVLAVFGAPLAHEDDAERAVRAGLAIRECSLSPAASPAPGELTVHVGINTGEVMAGLLGPQERRDYTVMGDAVNTAARLMSAAPAGTVLVGEETYRATSGRVRYRQMAPVEAKGKERP